MTPRQLRFVDEYMIDLNATQAAIRAGYSAKTAYSQGQRLLNHVELEGVIQATMVQVSKRVEVTVDDVVASLWAEAQGRADSTAGSRVAALGLLGKHLGMDRKDIQLQIDQPRVEDMTSEERDAEMETIRANIIQLMNPAELEVEKVRVTEELRRVEIACAGDSTTVFTALGPRTQLK